MLHTMKMREKIFKNRIRRITTIREEQFEFMSGRSTTDAIFALRQSSEKHREKKIGVYTVFIDLEKIYDSLLRQEI